MLLTIDDEEITCERLQLHKEKSKVKLLGGTVLKQTIPTSYL